MVGECTSFLMYPGLLHHYHSSQAQGSLPALSCSSSSSSSSSCTRRCMAIHHRSHTLLPPIFFLFTSTSSRRQPCLSSKSAVLARFRNTERSEGSTEEEEEHEDSLHPFDINLAVLLAGFAFESYNTPSENIWVHEVDGFDTETIFLSKQFLHDVYDGQLLIQLKRGRQFPGMDLWGTSDPYVVLRVGDCVVKSRTIWGTKDPVWDESLSINVKKLLPDYMQVTAWDANILGNHRRMGNAGVKLESICDGDRHEVCIELEGMGGGGMLYLEVQYKSFSKKDEEKEQKVPFLLDYSVGGSLGAALKTIFGIDGIKIQDFLASAICSSQYTGEKIETENTLDPSHAIKASESLEGINRCDSLVNEMQAGSDQEDVMISGYITNKAEDSRSFSDVSNMTKQSVKEEDQNSLDTKDQVTMLGRHVQNLFQRQIDIRNPKKHSNDESDMNEQSVGRGGDNCLESKDQVAVSGNLQDFIQSLFTVKNKEEESRLSNDVREMTKLSGKRKNENCLDTNDQVIIRGKHVQDFFQVLFADINKTLGDTSLGGIFFHLLNKMDANDPIEKLGIESQNKAEAYYIENGLAVPRVHAFESKVFPDLNKLTKLPSSSFDSIALDADIKKASIDLLRQTEEILGSWAMLAAALTGQTGQKEDHKENTTKSILNEPLVVSAKVLEHEPGVKHVGDSEMEDLRKMFKTAESAMEAWAILARSMGCPSFVKSEFEKICFIENKRTDTQVCVWRDSRHHRLVVAFRGTEQVKWKDLRTDLMLLPTGFNPERVAGNSKEEIMVHSGFLSAYDSVKSRLMSLLKASIQYSEDQLTGKTKWCIYSTGHSLGGALATLFALDLSLSHLHKNGFIRITMYNFGSPRVGNKKFSELYNQKVKDSWRVVNHRDIIPTVPRLMGYYHVAHPIYLSAGTFSAANVEVGLVEEGYRKDVIGEATPDFLVQEFMKGEKDLIQRLFQTEIAMLRALRDGSALMQHMEDFYYIALLERVSPSQASEITSKISQE